MASIDTIILLIVGHEKIDKSLSHSIIIIVHLVTLYDVFSIWD